MPTDSALDEVEAPVRAFIDATNAEDREAMLACFADDCRLTDFGRTFVSRAEIASWSERENIGVHSRFRVVKVTRVEAGVDVRVEVTGDGFNGSGTFHFAVSGDRIQRMVIGP